MEKSCCFIGHREIEITDDLIAKVTAVIEELIQNGVSRFLFGSRSDFDSLCHSIITELKKKYPQIIRVAFDTKSESSTLERDREVEEESYSRFFKKKYTLPDTRKSISPTSFM